MLILALGASLFAAAATSVFIKDLGTLIYLKDAEESIRMEGRETLAKVLLLLMLDCLLKAGVTTALGARVVVKRLCWVLWMTESGSSECSICLIYTIINDYVISIKCVDEKVFLFLNY